MAYFFITALVAVRDELKERLGLLLPKIHQQQQVLRDSSAIRLEEHHRQLKELSSVLSGDEAGVCNDILHCIDTLADVQKGFLGLLGQAKAEKDVTKIRFMGAQVSLQLHH